MTLARIAALLLVAFLISPAHAQDAPPRAAYQLKPGMELKYETKIESKGSMNSTATQTTTAWVLNPNADGSHRVLVRSELSYKHGDDDPQPFKQADLFAVDVAPDGRLANQTRSFSANPAAIFPPLPRDGQARWERTDQMGETTVYRLDDGATEAGQLRLWADSVGPMNEIYGIKQGRLITIDLSRGLMVGADHTSEQTYGFQTKGTGRTELKAVEQRDEAFVSTLVAEAKAYFEASDRYHAAMKAAESDPSQYDIAKAALDDVAAKLTLPELKEKLEKERAEHAQSAEYAKESAADRARAIGQPAFAWELKDLEGNTHKLEDYRGKVVVLDFWYRGCGWCIRAMPQMNQLAEDFKGKPVAILGINNDRKVEDARFVADKMKLAYPTLLGPDVPERYNIRGFPTLLIIDREGVVRDVHVGWSPTLREEVTAKVERLMKP